ncbi:MAG: hypothetical protein ACRDTT_11810 [Pseudonocardiaceae bacterium]
MSRTAPSDLHPIVLGVDECQRWYEHPDHGAEIEAVVTDLVKRGPALGFGEAGRPRVRADRRTCPGVAGSRGHRPSTCSTGGTPGSRYRYTRAGRVARARARAAWYLITCALWPWTACPRWQSTGKHRSPSGRAFRDCHRCGGRGRRVRLGAQLWLTTTGKHDH